MRTAREAVREAAEARGLPVHEDAGPRATTMFFGYYQVGFDPQGGWLPTCGHGPRLHRGRAALRDLLDALASAPDTELAPAHHFDRS